MERAPETLNLSYDAEAYRAWPVAFSLSANGSRSFPPQSVRCCITRSGAPGGSGTTSITITDLSGTGEIVLDVMWIEFHSEDTFEARITFTTAELEGWTGGAVPITLSFRPGGEVALIVDGPELAATRPGRDIKVETGEDMRALLTAPGLGRPHRRDDYLELRTTCGRLVDDPPDDFASREAIYSRPVIAEMLAGTHPPAQATLCDNTR